MLKSGMGRGYCNGSVATTKQEHLCLQTICLPICRKNTHHSLSNTSHHCPCIQRHTLHSTSTLPVCRQRQFSVSAMCPEAGKPALLALSDGCLVSLWRAQPLPGSTSWYCPALSGHHVALPCLATMLSCPMLPISVLVRTNSTASVLCCLM